jgi:hypothetical protein
MTRQGLLPFVMAICLAGALAGPAPATAGPAPPTPARSSDFNGDGFADLAVGAQDEAIGTKDHAGSVNVLYGSADGLTAANDQIWFQDSPGVIGTSEANDWFGAALASGDFDADGRADLAIGVPAEDLADVGSAGAVNVLYGTATGLSADRNQLWTQNSTSVPDAGEAGDNFGSALAAGDFDADGYLDLAVGVPGENLEPGPQDAGIVHVLYGSPGGLSAAGNQLWHQGADGILEQPQPADLFGASLAAGNFGRGRSTDLAIGAPNESYPCGGFCSYDAVGVVHVIYGSPAGLTADGNALLHQGDSLGFDDEGESFGSALAAGNFGKSRLSDLAVGVPGDGGLAQNTGSVRVLYGKADGLAGTGGGTFTLPGPRGSDDAFGAVLAAGDMGGTVQDDLAAAAPFAVVGGAEEAGAVGVFFGALGGLTDTGARVFSQATPGIGSDPAVGDRFGRSLMVADFGRDEHADLAVGVPHEDVGGDAGAGAVQVVYGTPSGLLATGSQFWSQDGIGVEGSGEPADHFGCTLAGSVLRRC